MLIGAESGAPEYELYRPSSPRRLSNGNIAVLDGRGELRVYDASGTFVRRVGRRGSGPGEFSGEGSLCGFRGDSLTVMDLNQRRATVLDGRGSVGRVFRLQAEHVGTFISGVGCTASGVLVGWTGQRKAARPEGFSRDSVILVAFDPEGALIYESTAYAGPYIYVVAQEGRLTFHNVPVSHATRFAVGDRYLVVADGGRNRIEKVELRLRSGSARATLELVPVARYESDELPPRLTREAIEHLIDRSVEGGRAATWREQRERTLRAMPWPERFPAVDRVLFDHLGHLWVRRPASKARSANEWLVLDDRLVPIAMATIPSALRVSEIGDDYVLGLLADSEGVDRIAMFPLTRSGESGRR